MGKAQNKLIQATKEGRLFIKNKDFFRQDKVQEQIQKLRRSSISQKIEKNKQEKDLRETD